MRYPIRIVLGAIALISILIVVVIASRWFMVPMEVDPTPIPTSVALATPLPPTPTHTPSPTPTPSSTFTPSPTPSPTDTPTPVPTPVPPTLAHSTTTVTPIATGTPPIPIPTPLPTVELEDGVINIVLLGTDQEENSSGWRTDVIVVVSINPAGPYVSLLSIPRDLYVWIPGYGFNRINTANYRGEVHHLPGGGPGTVKATIEYNLGIPIHYYAAVDFNSFVGIVDALGGIDVPVECELHDTFPNPENPEEGVDVDWMPGMQHLNGHETLWYVRSRWSTHDFDRNRRQQQVLRAIFRQALNLDIISHIPDLWETINQNVETDLGLSEMVFLGVTASQLDWADIKNRFVSGPYVEYWITPSGANVLLPLTDAIAPLVAEALMPPAAGRASQPPFRVEVLNGSGRPELGAVAVERLRWEGFEVTGLSDADQVYSRTTIVDLTTTNKGSPLALLVRLYRRTYNDILSQPVEGSPVDLRVILGADYDPCVSTSVIQYVPPPTPTPSPTPTTTPQ